MQTLPPALSVACVLMKDVQCAELNEKLVFQFSFFELSLKFVENWDSFEYKNDHNLKNKNRKIEFSFVSIYSANVQISNKFKFFQILKKV